MKTNKLLIIFAIALGTANTVKAQQEEKTVKPMPAALTKSPAADKPSASPVAKQIAADDLPATSSPATSTSSAKAVTAEDMKGNEINTGMKKGMPVINADRPKTSTIEPTKKATPSAKPAPVVATLIEG
jgi:hypothetical protein